MARGMCPTCNKIQNMRTVVTENSEKLENGKTKRIKTITFHCEFCNGFVISENHDLQEPGGND